jgi:radical SAM protein with 4Fe4S-binding SPASM domain
LPELVSAVANNYGLPEHVVRESTIQFLEEMIFNEFLVFHDSAQRGRVPTLSRVAALSELGFQELWLDVTSLCHGACRHCYKAKSDICHFPVRDLEELLVQAKSLGVANLTISGGEPLLHPEFPHLITLARRVSDWTIKVITAGQRPSSEIIDPLMANADIVQVSVDGLNKNTNDLIRGDGAFECVTTLLKLLHTHKDREKKKVGVAFTPLPQNIDQIEEMDEFVYLAGVDFIHFNHLKARAQSCEDISNNSALFSQAFFKKSLRSVNRLDIKMWDMLHGVRRRGIEPVTVDPSFAVYYDLFNLVKKCSCKAGMTTLAITEKADVYPCAGLQTSAETCLGNWMRERDLRELCGRGRRWSESVFSVDACEQCKACHFRYLCGGGCRARGNSVDRPDIMCEAIIESYHEFFESAGTLVQGKIDHREGEKDDKQAKGQPRLKRCI